MSHQIRNSTTKITLTYPRYLLQKEGNRRRPHPLQGMNWRKSRDFHINRDDQMNCQPDIESRKMCFKFFWNCICIFLQVDFSKSNAFICQISQNIITNCFIDLHIFLHKLFWSQRENDCNTISNPVGVMPVRNCSLLEENCQETKKSKWHWVKRKVGWADQIFRFCNHDL